MKRYWYAFMNDLYDDDWGTGTSDANEAWDKLHEWKKGDCSDHFIDVIDDDQVTEPMSVAHILQDDIDAIWEYEGGNYNRVYVFEKYRDKGGCGSVAFFDRPEEALKAADGDWNGLNEHDRNSYDEFRVYEITLTDAELAELNDPLGEVEYQQRETRELKDYTDEKALSKDEFYNAIKHIQYWDMDYVDGDVTRMGLYFFVHLNADGDLVPSVQDAEYSDRVLISDDDDFCEEYFNKSVSEDKELIIDELYPVYLDLLNHLHYSA